MDLDLDLLREAHGGYCVAHADGKVVFVRGGIPGERVRARLAEVKARWSTADVVEVLEPSPDRVAHVWPAAARDGVGGADLGHVAPAAQLRWKANVIADVLPRIGGRAVADALPAPVVVRAVGDGAVGTRTRVSFVADDDGRLAMRRPHSHDLVVVGDMPLAVPELAALDLFSGAWSWEPGERVSAVVPSASPAVVVTAAGVWEAPGHAAAPRVREVVEHDGSALHYVVAAEGFWQVHRNAPAGLVDEVMRAAALEGGESVLELFSGAGLFTLPLGRAVGPTGTVLSVEASRSAVDDANVNLASLPHVRALTGRVEARTVARERGPLDVVVLDPPRAGAGTGVVRALAARDPRRIVYVACDPASLARDLRELVPGYRVEHVAALDLFPHTHHVELVVTLARLSGRGLAPSTR